VLYVEHEPEQIATLLHKPLDEVRSAITVAKNKLFRARSQRKAPFVDSTIYASWNGMMISALFHAYRAFKKREWRDLALRSLERILSEHTAQNGLITHRSSTLAPEAFLDDQVQVIQALLDAFEVCATTKYLTQAERLMEKTIEFFWDREAGGFTDLPTSHLKLGTLEIKNKPIQDSPTEAGNAVAIINLLRLYALTERPTYREYADKTLRYFAGSVGNAGIFAATYCTALDLFLNPPPSIVIVSPAHDPRGAHLHDAALSIYRPHTSVAWIQPNSDAPVAPTMQTMLTSFSQPVAFVCSNFVCSPPVYDVATLESTLASLNRKIEIGS
jgi:uncharacterized protein YyaL (SSP411 family)